MTDPDKIKKMKSGDTGKRVHPTIPGGAYFDMQLVELPIIRN
jgi:hypothetical protein